MGMKIRLDAAEKLDGSGIEFLGFELVSNNQVKVDLACTKVYIPLKDLQRVVSTLSDAASDYNTSIHINIGG